MKTALTIGFFDGVHLGHRSLLKRLREKKRATIFTFSTHPLSVIKPPAPELLIPFDEKIALLKGFADEVIVVPFTKEFANTDFRDLLAQFSLSHLILGKGALFGKGRAGNEENVKKYGAENHFVVEYVPKLQFEGEPISSSRIRDLLKNGQFDLAQKLLGKTP